MTEHEIENINFFTKAEIENTGAKLEDVNVELFLRMQILRAHLGRRILLLPNGLTTGKHSSRQHPNGLACDFTFHSQDGSVDVEDIYYSCMHNADFQRYGVYWNGEQFSFHVEINDAGRKSWCAIKDENNEWKYFALMADPRNTMGGHK